MANLIFLFAAIAIFLSTNGKAGEIEDTKVKVAATWLQKQQSWSELEKGLYFNSAVSSFVNRDEEPEEEEQVAEKLKSVKFLLYNNATGKKRSEQLVIDPNGDSLKNSSYWRNTTTKFLIHGFTGCSSCPFPQLVKDAYLKRKNGENIIIVGWETLSMPGDWDVLKPFEVFKNYTEAVKNAKLVGRRVAEFVGLLAESGFTEPEMVDIVGFSLGAQSAGYAGRYVHENLGKKIGRIIALDPAGPLFITGLVATHVSSDDANYVEFIHTDMGQSGSFRSLGHSNFFVNSGYPPQPGCIEQFYWVMSFWDRVPLMIMGTCSHGRAPKYFSKSILDLKKTIKGVSCGGYIPFVTGRCSDGKESPFGEQNDYRKPGNYYVTIEVPATIEEKSAWNWKRLVRGLPKMKKDSKKFVIKV